jgi:hypothetical protein
VRLFPTWSGLTQPIRISRVGEKIVAVDRWDFIPAHNHLGSKLPVFCTLRSADVAKCVFFQLGQGSPSQFASAA